MTASGKRISVVIALYNGAEYLKEQLETIRTQTLPPDQVVMVDDGSTDNTAEVARAYIAEHDLQPAWQLYVNEQNLGYANNFRYAATLADCDYMFFSDQDDTWSPDKIALMTEKMEQLHDCVLLCTDYEPWPYGPNAQPVPASAIKKMPNNGVLEKVTLTKKSIYIGALGCCMCVRKDFYDSITDYWFDKWGQDNRLWKLAQCVDGCYLWHKNLIRHRIHGKNAATFGKSHVVAKRLYVFENMYHSAEQMKKLVTDGKARSMLDRHMRMLQLRIDLFSKRKLLNAIRVLPYLSYYERLRSYPLEILIALKN